MRPKAKAKAVVRIIVHNVRVPIIPDAHVTATVHLKNPEARLQAIHHAPIGPDHHHHPCSGVVELPVGRSVNELLLRHPSVHVVVSGTETDSTKASGELDIEIKKVLHGDTVKGDLQLASQAVDAHIPMKVGSCSVDVSLVAEGEGAAGDEAADGAAGALDIPETIREVTEVSIASRRKANSNLVAAAPRVVVPTRAAEPTSTNLAAAAAGLEDPQSQQRLSPKPPASPKHPPKAGTQPEAQVTDTPGAARPPVRSLLDGLQFGDAPSTPAAPALASAPVQDKKGKGKDTKGKKPEVEVMAALAAVVAVPSSVGAKNISSGPAMLSIYLHGLSGAESEEISVVAQTIGTAPRALEQFQTCSITLTTDALQQQALTVRVKAGDSLLGICEIPLAYLQSHFTYSMELCTANLSPSDSPLAPIRLYADVTLRVPTRPPGLQVRLGTLALPPTVLSSLAPSLFVVGKLVTAVDTYNIAHASMSASHVFTVTCPVTDDSELVLPQPTVVHPGLMHLPQRTKARRTSDGFVFDNTLCFPKPVGQVFTPASGLVLEFYQDKEDGSGLYSLDDSLLLGRILVKLDPSRIQGKPQEHTFKLTKTPILGRISEGTTKTVALDLEFTVSTALSASSTSAASTDDTLGTGMLEPPRTPELPSEQKIIPLAQSSIHGDGVDVMKLDREYSIFQLADAVRSPQGFESLGKIKEEGSEDQGAAMRMSLGGSTTSGKTLGASMAVPRMHAVHPVDMQRLTLDMEQMQGVITRLLEQVDQRAEAVRRLSLDLLQARSARMDLEKRNAELTRVLRENRESVKVAIDTEDLADVPLEQLVHSYVDLAAKYSTEAEALSANQVRVQQLQNAIIQKNEFERQILEQEHAHREACAQVQSLQDRAQRAGRYKDAVTKQLEVIQRLEDVLCRLPNCNVDGKTRIVGPSYQSLAHEHKNLQRVMGELQKKVSVAPKAADDTVDIVQETNETRQMQKTLERLYERVAALEAEEKLSAPSSGSVDRERLELMVRIEAGQLRVKSLREHIEACRAAHVENVEGLRVAIEAETEASSSAVPVLPGIGRTSAVLPPLGYTSAPPKTTPKGFTFSTVPRFS